MVEKNSPVVHLRQLAITDLDNVMAWVNDAEVTKNLAKFDHAITRKEESEYLEKLIKSPTDRVFSMEDKNNNYIGQIGIHQIYWQSRNGRLGIVIGNKNAMGKGYAGAAINAIIPIAFEIIGLNKLWAIFYATNARMQHICEKAGFHQEGLLKEEYFHKGKYHDMVRVALLKRDYVPAQQTMEGKLL